jgi:hypothetical protein
MRDFVPPEARINPMSEGQFSHHNPLLTCFVDDRHQLFYFGSLKKGILKPTVNDAAMQAPAIIPDSCEKPITWLIRAPQAIEKKTRTTGNGFI